MCPRSICNSSNCFPTLDRMESLWDTAANSAAAKGLPTRSSIVAVVVFRWRQFTCMHDRTS